MHLHKIPNNSTLKEPVDKDEVRRKSGLLLTLHCSLEANTLLIREYNTSKFLVKLNAEYFQSTLVGFNYHFCSCPKKHVHIV